MIEEAKFALLKLFSTIEIYKVRSLLELLAIGHEPYKKKIIWDLFRELGVIHILVISGSHVQGFLAQLRINILFFIKLSGLRVYFLLDPFLALGLWFLLEITGYQVALVRAAFCWLIPIVFSYFLPIKIGQATLLLFSIVCHVIFFPEHLKLVGFYLSWFCFLLVLWGDSLKLGYFGRTLFLTMASQGLVYWMGVDKALSFQKLSLYCLGNLSLIWLFERFLVPYIAQTLVIVFILSLGGTTFLMYGVEFLEISILPLLISGARIVCLAAEVLKTL